MNAVSLPTKFAQLPEEAVGVAPDDAALIEGPSLGTRRIKAPLLDPIRTFATEADMLASDTSLWNHAFVKATTARWERLAYDPAFASNGNDLVVATDGGQLFRIKP